MAGEISVIDPRTCPDWDAFVESHPDATVFHTSGWARVLLDAGDSHGLATHRYVTCNPLIDRKTHADNAVTPGLIKGYFELQLPG